MLIVIKMIKESSDINLCQIYYNKTKCRLYLLLILLIVIPQRKKKIADFYKILTLNIRTKYKKDSTYIRTDKVVRTES